MLEPGDVLVADANTGWTMHEAARVCDAVRDVDVYIEQPCASYEACLTIRRRTAKPFVLDEVMDGLDMVVRGHADGAMDVINLKIGKVGGLTRARQIRDFCVAMGIAMTIEDSWGGDIVTAAIAHLAHSTPPEFLFSATDFNSYVTLSVAPDAPRRTGGRCWLRAPRRAGRDARRGRAGAADPRTLRRADRELGSTDHDSAVMMPRRAPRNSAEPDDRRPSPSASSTTMAAQC